MNCFANGAIIPKECRTCSNRRLGSLEKTKEAVRLAATKHGHFIGNKASPTRKSWESMVDRCTNPNNVGYEDYGGRGITVCDRWLGPEGFVHFLADMGVMPPGLQIERIKNEIGYSKSNCKWATRLEQARNKRNNVRLTHDGKTLCIAEWAEITGISDALLRYRVGKKKMSHSAALTTPVEPRKKR